MLRWMIWLAAVSLVLAAPFNSELDEQWNMFKKAYNKDYKASEEGARRLIFEENVQYIVQHNLEADLGKHKFRLGINQFADLTHQEYVKMTSCLKMEPGTSTSKGTTFVPPSEVKTPDEIDWTTKGYVTEVKNQGMCGSCYAFAATGALEGQHMKQTGKLVSLSEQNIVDCSEKFGNQGCGGGLPNHAFLYITTNGGVDTEESYPYAGEVEKCNFKSENIGANCSGSLSVEGATEDTVKDMLAITGPFAVALDAGSRKFQLYKNGVYEDEECNAEKINHAVLMVGYGEKDEEKFWKVKNSWGKEWGMEGYFLIARNKNKMCGIADNVFLPIV